MTKYFTLMAATLAFMGCTKPAHITVNGKAPGLTDAVYFLKDAGDSTLAADNISNGSFKIDTDLPTPGYGHFSVNKNGVEEKNEFEVYLESGEYTVEVDPAKISSYPKITTASKIQNELSAYYKMYAEMNAGAHERYEKALAALQDKKAASAPHDAYVALVNQLSSAEKEETKSQFKTISAFINKYPQSPVGAHIMANVKLEENVAGYNELFNKLSTDVRNTTEAKAVGQKLGRLAKLVPGASAPTLSGTTPDGKPFNAASLDKPGYIIDFWRAGNAMSRKNHQEMIANILKDKRMHGFGIISVSLDSKRDWWTTAIADDKLTWLQVSDLKGDDSPNVQNWAINRIPTYYLVDSKWRIIESDVPLENLIFSIDDYAVHH